MSSLTSRSSHSAASGVDAQLGALLDEALPPGRIAVIARSPALAREVIHQLPAFGLGTSRVVCLPAAGPEARYLELLKSFNAHWGTDAVLLLGAIDADEAEVCMAWIARHMKKPVIGYIDSADPSSAQQAQLRASGVHMSPDAAGIGALTASLVETPWLPFD